MTKTKLENSDYIPPTWYSYLNYDVGPRNTRTYNHALTAFVSNAYNTRRTLRKWTKSDFILMPGNSKPVLEWTHFEKPKKGHRQDENRHTSTYALRVVRFSTV